MSIYYDKLVHVQVVINCLYSIAQMCNCEDTLAHNIGTPYIDDVTSYNSLKTIADKFNIWKVKCVPSSNGLLADPIFVNGP